MSPLRNRVTPLGEIVAHPARGEVYGNRGCLHDADGTLRRAWQVRRWIACRLEFKGRRRQLLRPGRYTELFFLDEATAFAAGHRPCAECRRADYARFQELWRGANTHADAMDGALHAERLGEDGARRIHDAAIGDLPDGTFVLRDGEPFLVRGRELLRWTPAGYTDRMARPARGRAALLTPPALVHVLASEWSPVVTLIHDTARHAPDG